MIAAKGPPKDSVLLGKYRVESTLGFGGMGLVIQAHNIALDERVAIKFLREDVQLDSEHVERFLREAKAAVRLRSEHVAKIRDVGTLDDGRPYMIMELLEGVDLGKLLSDGGALDPTRAVDLLLQACDAIAEAHANGIVHRDVKPSNLFITQRRDGSELLKVLDFGISKAQAGPEMSLTQTSSMLGTPAYMSPEQMRSARTVDPRSDIWALGTVLYEAVEGHLPFEATNFAELCVLVATENPSPMQRAPQLQGVLERCLAKSANDRFQDVGELARALEPYASEPGSASRAVNRILRVLGKPGTRDSTPLPMSRDSLRAMGLPPTPTAGTGPIVRPTLERSGGAWNVIALVLALFGVGAAAGLYVTKSGPFAQQDAIDSPPDAASRPVATPAPVDAGSEPATSPDASPPIDAAVVTPDAGIATTTSTPTPPRRPPRRPPPRRPPPPEPTATPAPQPPPPPPPPPKPACDPFASKNGCK